MVVEDGYSVRNAMVMAVIMAMVMTMTMRIMLDRRTMLWMVESVDAKAFTSSVLT